MVSPKQFDRARAPVLFQISGQSQLGQWARGEELGHTRFATSLGRAREPVTRPVSLFD